MRTAEASIAASLDADDAIDLVLRDRLVTPHYQPIVDLASRSVVAVESLARGPVGSALERPDQLFDAARRAGRLGAMDLLCTERAVECALSSATPPPLLFCNAEPAVLDQPFSPRLLELVLGELPFRMILEYTERGLPTVPGALLRVAGTVEACGNGIALDDVGADPMSLAFLPIIEPEVIKLDMHLLRNPHAPATLETCRIVRAAARRTGAVVIAEGVETEADLRTALALGATWGQGWLFGRPVPIEALDLSGAARFEALRPSRPGFHQPAGTPFEIAAARGAPRAGTVDAVVEAVTRMCAAVGPDDAAVVVASCDDPEVVARIRRVLDTVTSPGAYVAVTDPAPAQPAPAEIAVAVIGTDGAEAVCLRTPAPGTDQGELVRSGNLPTVAAVGRALLKRLA
ncbi:EAL domain-containing protein [Actinoplanes aureus]|uniref:EAL domain-containing protein n=1 Tax=Actinoplanes aureus TaxID=2792083 RepID=A0A931C9V2_9ACTN|nr:EAL domain-containing protein [Actinoplanes aureus]MBG0564032.1 EAL domain-containing protein [Actinoplanes aureus]